MNLGETDMARPLIALIAHLRRVLDGQDATSVTDAQLVNRWLEQRDEAAFEMLLMRHGPLVLGVCRRLLRHTHDIEDAFQATFLILMRKASSVRKQSSLASWLYTVAYRVASRLRASIARRQNREEACVREVHVEAQDGLMALELATILEEEINRLPDKYRSAFILCHIQGKTNAQAAAELGCPVGTILSRLAWARERVSARLSRRGVAPGSMALLAVAAIESMVPRELAAVTVRVATSWGTEAAIGGSSGAISLAKGALQTMANVRLKLAALAVLGLTFTGTATIVTYRSQPQRRDPGPLITAAVAAQPSAPRRKALADVPALRDGPLTVIGTELQPGESVPERKRLKAKAGYLFVAILPGEKVPAAQQTVFPGIERRYRRWNEGDPIRDPSESARIDGEKQTPFLVVAEEVREFKRLDEGDKVKAGQMVALVDPILAIRELSSKLAQMNVAEADVRSSKKTKQESFRRHVAIQNAIRRLPGSVTKDDMEGARLTYERYAQEQIAKEAGLVKAQQELLQAASILDRHTVRTRNSGTVREIYKALGEAVKYLEPVLQVAIVENER